MIMIIIQITMIAILMKIGDSSVILNHRTFDK